MGLFAVWQPEYAAHGIATFPVGPDKRPATKGYGRTGLKGSRELAEKFADADAFGIMCGRRNHVTLADVDTADDGAHREALERHGDTPIITRSPSGGVHLWYRHNGERRRIRPFGKDVPIDVLGDGGLVIAPPSLSARGQYRLVRGSLDDLDRLPVMRGLEGLAKAPAAPADARSRSNAAGPKAWREMRSGDGRNAALMREVGRAAHQCDDQSQLLDYALFRNGEFGEPLLHAEVGKLVAYWWMKTERGENRFGVGKVVQFDHSEVDGLLMENPDAFQLLTILRRRHWGRDFVVANAMADTMPGGGWRRQRFTAARRYLEERGHLVVIRPASRNTGPALYRLRSMGGQK